MAFRRSLPRLWFRRRLALPLWPLLPLSWLFGALVRFRRVLFRWGVLPSYSLPVPVVVIGNLTVGGSGKTPLVLWLANALRERGFAPGIVSRGYGAEAAGVRLVSPRDDAACTGDEPLLLARRAGVPVVVGADRVAAGRVLLAAHPECRVLIADDGLQHYRLRRSLELAVFDGRGAGNAHLLPAGPLREPLSRTASLDGLVWNGASDERVAAQAGRVPQFSLRLIGERFVSLRNAQLSCTANDLRGKRLFAIAGIGDPQRFFIKLEAVGLAVESRAFPDHHSYSTVDLDFALDGVLLMTEKDAVKCAAIVTGEAWFLPVDAQFDDDALLKLILEKLNGCPSA